MRSSLPITPEILSALQLAPDERVLWASESSGVSGIRRRVVWIAYGVFVSWFLSLAVSAILFVLETRIGGSATSFVSFLRFGAMMVPLAAAAGALGLLIAWLVPRGRLTHFVTTRRVLSRTLRGDFREVHVSKVHAADRIVVRERTRYGYRYITTDRVRLKLTSGEFELGPSRDIDRALDLVNRGGRARTVDLELLASVDGKLAPAECHDAFFVTPTSSESRDPYGPLFVGPRVIVRLTEPLPSILLDQLYVTLAAEQDGERAELALVSILRSSVSGHFLELPRAETAIEVRGTEAVFTSSAGRTFRATIKASHVPGLARIAAAEPRPASSPLVISPYVFANGDEPTHAHEEAARPPARSADLVAPTLTASGVRSVKLSALPSTQRTELLNVLAGGRHLFFAAPRFFDEHRRAVMLVAPGIFLVVFSFFFRYGMACAPTQSAGAIAIYAIGASPLAWLACAWVLHVVRRATLPFTAGTYVFARELVIARSDMVRFVPLAQTIAVHGGPKRALSSHASITFFVESEASETCFVPASRVDEDILRIDAARAKQERGEATRDPMAAFRASALATDTSRLGSRRSESLLLGAATAGVAVLLGGSAFMASAILHDRGALADAGSDLTKLACYADHGGASAHVVRSRTMPRIAYAHAQEEGTISALTEVIQAYPASPEAARAREDRESLEWAQADNAWKIESFIRRHPRSRHIDEARRRWPSLALRAARERNDARAFSAVMRVHSGTPEAAEAAALRRERFRLALDAVHSKVRDARARALYARLFDAVEANPDLGFALRFARQDPAALARIDASLASVGARVAPISAAFDDVARERHEATLFALLRSGLADVVPAEIFSLSRAPSDAPRSDGRPEILVEYEIVPTRQLIEVRPRDGAPAYATTRTFLGFQVNFHLEIGIVGDRDAFELDFAIAPPRRLDLPTGVDLADAEIYDHLARSAFDAVGIALRAALTE